jgi:hypothetical protein
MKLTSKQVEELVQRTLDGGARAAMRRTIGDHTSGQFDRADEMAEGIRRGIRNALLEMNLRDPDEND